MLDLSQLKVKAGDSISILLNTDEDLDGGEISLRVLKDCNTVEVRPVDFKLLRAKYSQEILRTYKLFLHFSVDDRYKAEIVIKTPESTIITLPSMGYIEVLLPSLVV